jgi:hypothetical protein
MKHDYLKWGALAAALVATASAEYELARAVGFNQWVAAAVPGALDLYTVRALRTGKEVLAAVAAMIGVNAASHLVTAGLVTVSVPLVVAVSAIAPLVLWRVHSLGAGHPVPETPSKLDEVDPPEVTAPVTVERVDGDQPRALVEAPEVVPAGARMLPLVARPELVEVTADPADDDQQDTGEPHTEMVTPPWDMRSPDWTVPGDYWKGDPVLDPAPVQAAETAREVVTEVITLTPSELLRRARKLNRELVTSTNRPVTIERLREEYGLTRREAAELRRQVVTPEGGERS